jgi:hypothetical protein
MKYAETGNRYVYDFLLQAIEKVRRKKYTLVVRDST